VAETSDGVVGFVSAGRRWHGTGETDAYIGELVVSTSAEQQGLATALVAAVEQWAPDQGYRRVTLETCAANEGARGFYAALGYQMEQVVLSTAIPAPSPL
jgi:ribosomal protein S18 acetylase RimI-like enzyme